MSLFPPGVPLLHGPRFDAELAEWCGSRIPHVGSGAAFGPCWPVGVVRARKLAAVVVFHEYQPGYGTVQVSVAADDPRWASRRVIAAVLGVAFDGKLGAPVRKVWSVMPHRNHRAIKFNLGIGFRREAVLRYQFSATDHGVVTGIMRREFERRYGGSDGVPVGLRAERDGGPAQAARGADHRGAGGDDHARRLLGAAVLDRDLVAAEE